MLFGKSHPDKFQSVVGRNLAGLQALLLVAMAQSSSSGDSVTLALLNLVNKLRAAGAIIGTDVFDSLGALWVARHNLSENRSPSP